MVIDLVRADADAPQLVGCTDAAPGSREVAGLEVLGDDTILPRLRADGVTHAFVALGHNARRQRVAMHAQALGFTLFNAISGRASISSSARLGTGVAVMPGAVINASARIGDLVIVNSGAVVEHDVSVDDAAHVGPGSVLTGGAKLGTRAFLGAGACVIPGKAIGADSVVGAGACVVSDLPSGIVAFGVPARVRRGADVWEDQ